MPLLSDVLRPGSFRILSVDGDEAEVVRLKRLGICQNRRLEVISTGNPLIVSVAGTRLGVSRSVTQYISVESQPCSETLSAEGR
jgi:Fe2+ transport system protein FeoA